MMLWLILCLTAAGAFGAGLAMAQRKTRELGEGDLSDEKPPLALPEPWTPPHAGGLVDELYELKTNDVVEHMGQDHCVAEARRYTGSGLHLLIARMLDEPDVAVVVFDAPEPLASLVKRSRGHTLPPQPPDALVHDGLRFRRLRRVEMRRHGGAEQVVLQFYEGPDGVHLWLVGRESGLDVYDGRLLRDGSCLVLKS